jgi:hypothetical protein
MKKLEKFSQVIKRRFDNYIPFLVASKWCGKIAIIKIMLNGK